MEDGGGCKDERGRECRSGKMREEKEVRGRAVKMREKEN
jgi:hypothetical protein